MRNVPTLWHRPWRWGILGVYPGTITNIILRYNYRKASYPACLPAGRSQKRERLGREPSAATNPAFSVLEPHGKISERLCSERESSRGGESYLRRDESGLSPSRKRPVRWSEHSVGAGTPRIESSRFTTVNVQAGALNPIRIEIVFAVDTRFSGGFPPESILLQIEAHQRRRRARVERRVLKVSPRDGILRRKPFA